jgi:adenylate cyclase
VATVRALDSTEALDKSGSETAADSSCDTSPVAQWLIEGARSAPQPPDVLAQLCEQLVACGIPLRRVSVFVLTLHPQVMGRRLSWQPDTGVTIIEAGYERRDDDIYRLSPVVHVYNTGIPLRRRLADADCPIDFAMLGDLRAEGITDYLVSPLVFTNGEVHAVTWATLSPVGFTDAQLAGIETIVAPLARLTEIHALRRTASNLLDAYVGHQAGERILGGRIRRGDCETIHAVIWLSDMRGFTALADAMPPRTLIDLLNNYFDCQVPAILDRGGEVLKFMGDGLLAIFPLAGNAADLPDACEKALAAACEIQTKIAAADALAGVDAGNGARFGLALHVGEVLYGNIGSANRLDFTCIGTAVNLAARLEELTSETGRPILASGEFARHCRDRLMPLGEFPLRGFAALQPVFALADSA